MNSNAAAVSPFGNNARKVMMWVFIISDALIFSFFLAVYGFYRFITPAWPNRWAIFEPWYIAAMTILLLSSSTTMAIAVEALKEGKRSLFAAFYWVTFLAGLVFLAMQANEWHHFIGEGARLTSNPWGVPIFSTLFFVITGFHGFHVFTGVLILAIAGVLWTFGKVSPEQVELVGLYWSFVDLVWVFVFAFVYLL